MPRNSSAARQAPCGGGELSSGGHRAPMNCSTAVTSCKLTPRHGRIAGDVWLKSARASIHMLRVPKSWAVDVSDMEAAAQCGVRLVCIHDLEQLTHFWATLETLRLRGFAFDRGYGEQRALPLEHWAHSRGAAERLGGPAPEPDAESAVEQLALAI